MPSAHQDRSGGYTGSNVSRWLYADDLADFLNRPTEHVLGELSKAARDDIVLEQRNAWRVQIDLLQRELRQVPGRGRIYFEYVIPRLGKRVTRRSTTRCLNT
jgi:hypothetical protein